MLPMQARVRVQFNRGEQRLAVRDFPLAASGEWRDFAIPVFRPPVGADAIVLGFGLSEKTDGRIYFSTRYADGGPVLTRPARPEGLARSVGIRLEQSGGAWWLIAPDGKAFGRIATSTASSGRNTVPVLWACFCKGNMATSRH